MRQLVKLLLWQFLLLKVRFNLAYTNVPANAINPDSVVLAYQNMSAPAGSEVVLQCYSQRMVWTQDRLVDRQRVAHWDSFSDYTFNRILDMFSADEQRLYNPYDQGRIMMSPSAFSSGNFSLVIKDVRATDRGIYSCHLHHHYCHLYETVKIQLNITKAARKVKRFWDGEKEVVVALLGTTVLLPCENYSPIWTERHHEEEQQVVHWDRSPPGVWHDQADRLIDLYASGEQRSYGSQFIRKRMNISDTAFKDGDFSLTISNLRLGDEGLYSCDLHHHYCGIHERRIFTLSITQPIKVNLTHKTPSTAVEIPNVINVFIPDHSSHFLHQLGYVLATLLLLAILITIIALITRQHRRRGLQYNVKMAQPRRTEVNLNDFVIDTTGLRTNKNEEIKFAFTGLSVHNDSQILVSKHLPISKLRSVNSSDHGLPVKPLCLKDPVPQKVMPYQIKSYGHINIADYKNNILKEKFALSREKVELLREIPPKNLDRDCEKKYWK